MKKFNPFLVVVIVMLGLLLHHKSLAQAPERMSYQGVVRNSGGTLITDQDIGMKISILQGSPAGTLIYQEIYNPNPHSNINGLVSLEIGSGIPLTGTFATIDWSGGPYFIRTETDPVGGTNYTISGTSQLLSVPFALHAKTAEGITGTITETDPTVKVINGIVKSNGTTISAAVAGDFPILNQNTTGNAATATIVTAAAQPAITSVGTLSSLVVSGTTTVPTPVNGTDATNKAYVDELLIQIEELQVASGLRIKDIDGNLYKTVTIGTQVWMAENLKTTRYNDGTGMAHVQDNNLWGAFTYGAYSDYDNNPSNSNTYGRLYNWYVVDNNPSTWLASNGGKSVCPTGWHVPTHSEWSTLETYLVDNGYNYDGTTVGSKFVKSLAATTNWSPSSTPGAPGNTDYPANRNITGFTALPGASHNSDGSFSSLGDIGFWWSTTEVSSSDAYARVIFSDVVVLNTFGSTKNYGYSVRCLKD